MIRQQYTTVLFDMDGVLYDSMKRHVFSYQQSLRKYGMDMQEATVYACEGMKGTETIALIAKEQQHRDITIQEAEEIYEEKCRIFRTLPEADKIEGVDHLLQSLKNAGKQICVVTGSGQLSLLDRLTSDFAGLIDHDHIICSKDYTKGKPAPDPYLTGLRRCNAEASKTIVVENAPLGVRAGKAAGIFTIAVNTGPLPRTVFEEAGADMIFDSMTEAEQWLFGEI